MPRKTKEEIEQEVEKKEVETPQAQQGVMEVPINLELLNNKLNYLISKIDLIVGSMFQK